MLNKLLILSVFGIALTGIITGTVTVSAQEDDYFIPDMIKNPYGWGDDGVISDEEFVNILQYMIDEKIILPYNSDLVYYSLELTTDKEEYKIREPVKINIANTGNADLYLEYGRIRIQDKNLEMAFVIESNSVELGAPTPFDIGSSGTSTWSQIHHSGTEKLGMHTISTEGILRNVNSSSHFGSHGEISDFKTILITNDTENIKLSQSNESFPAEKPPIVIHSIPSWIKNTAGWWSHEITSDREFINSLQYLIDEKIILIDNSNLQFYSIDITTDKDEYLIDQNVIVTIRNTGNDIFLKHGVYSSSISPFNSSPFFFNDSELSLTNSKHSFTWERSKNEITTPRTYILTTFIYPVDENKNRVTNQVFLKHNEIIIK